MSSLEDNARARSFWVSLMDQDAHGGCGFHEVSCIFPFPVCLHLGALAEKPFLNGEGIMYRCESYWAYGVL